MGRGIGPAVSTIGRLKRRSDFLAVASGRRFHTERMTAQGRLREPGEVRDDGPAEGLYLGFTITKRVGHATERNRIRRRLRSAVAAVAEDAPLIPADVVLVARRPALTAPFEDLVADLRRSLGVVTKPRTSKPSDVSAKPSARKRGTSSASPSRETGGGTAHTPREAGRRDASPPTQPAGAADRVRPPSPNPNERHGSSDGQ